MATPSTTATTTYTSNRVKPAPVSTTERCCDCGCKKTECKCCELICFERPDYHCGHLLTDADLSLQIRYLVEKNKLRNRTLFGTGVVCGLKMTCDPDCCDHILIHEGYAIDACGNDIVVCETACFDVIAALRAKHLIAKVEERDRCKPEVEEHCCDVPQCFYVSICYEEEDAEFQTPFQAGCASGPQDCVPTRIKERFRIEVSDKPPEHHSYLDWLEKRLRHCFRLFIDSPVGRLMQKEMALLKTVADGKAEPTTQGKDRYCEVFCLLKAQFQQQIKQCRDQLSCDLAKEVACLTCPDAKGDQYGPAMQAAYASLFKLMHQYQYDCVLADLVFDCKEPKEGGCVLLGCVLVDDCCVLRVSNTHRRYVWSFANILQILITTVLTAEIEAAEAAEEGDREHKPKTCCDDFVDFDHRAFLAEFEVNPAGRYYAAAAPVRVMRALHKSVAANFAFADSTAISPALFAGADPKLLMAFAEQFGLQTSTADVATELSPLSPMQAVMSESLIRRNDGVRMYPAADGKTRAVLPDFVREASPERVLSLQALEQVLNDRDKTITDLRSSVTDLQTRIAKLESGNAPEHPPG
jgi:hypothetical protein